MGVDMYLNILLPVLNEEKRLKRGVINTINYFSKIGYADYELTIIDNGSEDHTRDIALKLKEKYQQVNYIRLEEKGVGIAFRTGVLQNKAEIVGYMDIDLSTDISHISDMIRIFQKNKKIDMVNASRLNKKSNTIGRKWYRMITSYGLSFVLKLFLHMKATDAICGFKFFRKQAIEKLISSFDSNEKGWFYVIELLLRAERSNLSIFELPVKWEDDYNTTVHVWKLIKNYMRNIFILRRKFKKEGIL